MRLHKVVSTLLMLVGMVGVPMLASAQSKMSSGCNPNGNRFDLEPLVNAPLLGQANESVALIPGRGGNGVDLVVGTAADARPLILFDGPPNPAYYVQRDNSNCEADFEGGMAYEGFVPVGTPQVVADPAHDAFFMGYAGINVDTFGIGIVKGMAANLLNATNCPNGTQLGLQPEACWPISGVADPEPVNIGLGSPSIAVDQRTQGTGAGDVYVTAVQFGGNPYYQIILTACANSTLECGSSVIISGADSLPNYSSVQVRPDGGITVSYANVVIENHEIFEYQIKFVNCTPKGAPNPPACTAPILVTTQEHLGTVMVGDSSDFAPVAYPRHVDRLESDGITVTTFLIFDQCAVAQYTSQLGEQDCPKTQVVMASSTDGGNTWSSFRPVAPNTPGQQFLGNIALDVSTGTVNIAYYSSQNDTLRLRMQIFLAQVLPGTTTVGTINQVTTSLYDGQPGCFADAGQQPLDCGYQIGVAAAGTGQSGQSHVYIHFNGSTANGSFNGQAFPIYTNTLTQFDY